MNRQAGLEEQTYRLQTRSAAEYEQKAGLAEQAYILQTESTVDHQHRGRAERIDLQAAHGKRS